MSSVLLISDIESMLTGLVGKLSFHIEYQVFARNQFRIFDIVKQRRYDMSPLVCFEYCDRRCAITCTASWNPG